MRTLWRRRLPELVVRPDFTRLRKGGKKGYFIPEGGMFRWISCPNFFGEILQWTGFAVMTWSPAALVFALWTFFNLVPRALSHHKWYKSTFPEYPPERKGPASLYSLAPSLRPGLSGRFIFFSIRPTCVHSQRLPARELLHPACGLPDRKHTARAGSYAPGGA